MRERSADRRLLFGLAIFLILASLGQLRAGPGDPGLKAEFNSSGLASLKFGEIELLAPGNPEVARLKALPALSGNTVTPTSASFDTETKTVTDLYSWGAVTITCRPEPNRLLINLTVTNKSDSKLTDAGFDLFKLHFPATPAGYDWEHHYNVACQSPDALPALLADWKTARMALCSENLDQQVKFTFRAVKGDAYAVNLQFDSEPILPGGTRSASLSLRFGDNSSPGWEIARDVLHKFAEKYPSEMNWSDRRAIGSAFLSTSIAGYKNNPRGWFLDRELNTGTPEGRAQFRKMLMAYADRVIAHCKLVDAQGVIVWDLEGQEMPHATSYIADARMLSKVAPEMDAVADEFFKKLSDAGLRTGVTIRPTRIEPLPDGKPGWTQVEVENPVAEMDSKMSYATRRWGCSIFYLDSNVNFVRDKNGKILNDPAMAAQDFQTLLRQHKNCLLIPERKTARYWAYTAPYCELRLGFTGTAPEIHEAYPHAFSVIQVVDGPPLDSPEVVDRLTAAINSGDILLFRPWWDDPTTAQIKQIYTRAQALRAAAQ